MIVYVVCYGDDNLISFLVDAVVVAAAVAVFAAVVLAVAVHMVVAVVAAAALVLVVVQLQLQLQHRRWFVMRGEQVRNLQGFVVANAAHDLFVYSSVSTFSVLCVSVGDRRHN